MKAEGIIFDLDGTLVDSIGGITAALNEALADGGFPAVDAAHVRGIVGDGPRNLCRRALGDAGRNDDVVARTLVRFQERYAAAPVRDTLPFPGVPEVLARLAPRPLGVCTNKGRRVAGLVLDALGITRHVKAYVAEDDLPWRKPDPRPLLRLAEQLGTPPGATLVVGDGRQDVLAARAAGMPSCALFQGYTGRDALLDARPDHVLEVIADLPRLVS